MRSTRGMHSSAVAGVIEALLLVALVSIVISMIQLVYVPQMMQQKEADHMDAVFNQFSEMKSMVDMQAISRSTSPISSMLTLGSPKMPYFLTVPALGKVSYSTVSTSYVMVFPPPGSFPPNGVTLSSVRYESENSYFVDQTYALEGGGIVVQQPGSDPVMRADPSVAAVNDSTKIVLHVNLPVFIGVPGKLSTEGEGKCFIRTNYSSNQTYFGTIPSNCYIRIYTSFDKAWNQSLHSILGVYDRNGYISVDRVVASPTSYVQIAPGTKTIDLYLNVIQVFVQIGPGWVE
jgi:hypothetical protein